MKITEGIARNIVREISSTIHQAVNLMDDTGIIIASTNVKRIGSRHEGAKKIIREGLDCLEIYSDGEYQGSKLGINMPVYFKGSVVGVIGISGEWNQIEPYINLIQKTAETMVLNDYLQKQENEAQKQQRQYLYKLLFEKQEKLPEDYLKSGISVGFDVFARYRCICISITDGMGGFPEELHILLDAMEEAVGKLHRYAGKCIVYREMVQLTVFLLAEGEEGGRENSGVEMFEREVRRQYVPSEGMRVKIGIDDCGYSGFELRTGRKRAEKSLKAAMTGTDTLYYTDMTVGVFLSEIPDESKWEYIQKIFGQMKKAELAHWMEVLEIFYECDGSIQKTADQMFIHKNTLQYQLKKLASITSYDPRSMKNAAVYQNAIWFFRAMGLK